MTPERWERVTEIFNQALDLAEAERIPFIEAECGSDGDLRNEVLRMLEQYARAGSFLETQALKFSFFERGRAFAPGDVVSDRYRVVRLLGQGGMGDVYEAEDLELGGLLALKTVRFDVASHELSLARFRQEIHLSRKINHPNVCRVYDIARHVTEDRSVMYFTMELLTGPTLAERLRSSGSMSTKQALPLICQMAQALAAAHQAGIIHRDFKPSNVILQQGDAEREAVVTDFGLARLSSPSRERSITETGLVMGTPAYMAPEQLIGEPLSIETDVYAFGLVVYEMVTGRLPFRDESVSNAELRRLRDQPEPPSRYAPGLDARWEAAILQCLEREPARRFHNALDLAAVLIATRKVSTQRIGIGKASAALPVRFTPAMPLILTAVLGILVGGLVWYQWLHRSPTIPQEAKKYLDSGTNAIRDGVYWNATKQLRRAIEIYPAMPLAHARLAEAWTELQDPNKAKNEMFLANAPDSGVAFLSGVDKLQFEAVYLTIKPDFPGAVQKYEQILKAVPDADKHYAYVDLGEAYERNAQWQRALNSFKHATSLDSTSPAGFLRLGMLYNKRRQSQLADEALKKAYSLYRLSDDSEGESEAEFQLANNSGKPAEARLLLQKALARAADKGNVYQEVRIRLLLAAQLASDGDLTQAMQEAQNATAMAKQNDVQVLAASGLIEIGNALLLSRDPTKAEDYFKEAQQIAHSYHADRQENAALLDLGSFYMSTHRPDEVLKYAGPARLYFESNGFRMESSRASSLIGRLKRDQGDFAEALSAFGDQLRLSKATEDEDQIAGALEEIGAVEMAQESFPAAVRTYEKAFAIRQHLGAKLDISYSRVNLADALGEVGQVTRASQLLSEEERAGTSSLPLLDRAELLLIQGDYKEAISICNRSAPKPDDAETSLARARILGLCLARTGKREEGLRLCVRAVAIARRDVPLGLPAALVALLAVESESGQEHSALQRAALLIPELEKKGQVCSAWRCSLYAGLAAKRLGDQAKARSFGAQSQSDLALLKTSWQEEDYRSYSSRRDVKNELSKLSSLNESGSNRRKR